VVATILLGSVAGSGSDRPDLENVLTAPSRGHPLGTDELGRDIAARIVRAAALSLTTAALAWLAAVVMGLAFGGYSGARPDSWGAALVRNTIILFYTTPVFVLMVAVAGLLGPGLGRISLILALASWAGPARHTAAIVESLREATFVLATRSFGYGPLATFGHAMLPEVYRPVVAAALAILPEIIALDAALSFFGLGVAPPTPTLGRMIIEGVTYLPLAWWMSAAPVIMLAALCLSIRGLAREIMR
jgi:peptide/nickel transport system permease protein